jgi:hypothetical protein
VKKVRVRHPFTGKIHWLSPEDVEGFKLTAQPTSAKPPREKKPKTTRGLNKPKLGHVRRQIEREIGGLP